LYWSTDFNPYMRLDSKSVELIRQVVLSEAGAEARVRLFGSRVDDQARGGDVDLLLEMPRAPANAARLASAVSGQVSRALHGRRVDVLIDAPGLRRLPIHEVALRQGVLL
jgi:predicted nucleotidyltransferase